MNLAEKAPPIVDAECSQKSVARFVLFAGSLQQIAEVLFATTLQLHIKSDSARTIYIEHSRSYAEAYDIVRKSTRGEKCYVVFEAINDARFLPLIKALLSRNFTIFGGTEAYSCEDALNNLRKLTCPGWDAETGQYTSKQTSSMALAAMRNIEMFYGGVEVIDLQSDKGALQTRVTV
jgi:hypothetical protein